MIGFCRFFVRRFHLGVFIDWRLADHIQLTFRVPKFCIAHLFTLLTGSCLGVRQRQSPSLSGGGSGATVWILIRTGNSTGGVYFVVLVASVFFVFSAFVVFVFFVFFVFSVFVVSCAPVAWPNTGIVSEKAITKANNSDKSFFMLGLHLLMDNFLLFRQHAMGHSSAITLNIFT